MGTQFEWEWGFDSEEGRMALEAQSLEARHWKSQETVPLSFVKSPKEITEEEAVMVYH